MNLVAKLAVGMTASAAVALAIAGSVSSEHPIIGDWLLSIPTSTCHEKVSYSADGHRRSISGDEVMISDFEIAPTPSDKGFYRITYTITKSNGKPDCSESITPVGDTVTLYLRFFGRDIHYVCRAEDLEVLSCFYFAFRK